MNGTDQSVFHVHIYLIPRSKVGVENPKGVCMEYFRGNKNIIRYFLINLESFYVVYDKLILIFLLIVSNDN